MVALPSYQEGVRRTSDLIRKGYPALAQAFATGKVNFQDPGLQGDLNRWLSGKRTPGMTPYVSKIASSMGQGGAVGAVPTPQATTPQAAVPSEPFLNPNTLSRSIRDQFIQGQGTIDLTSLPGTVRGAWQTPKPRPPDVVPGTAATPVTPGAGGIRPSGSDSLSGALAPRLLTARRSLASSARSVSSPGRS